MISVHFQGKPFNIRVIQVYAPASNVEELKLNGSMKMYKLGFEEAEEGNLKQIRLPTFFGSWRRKGVLEKHLLLLY